MKNLLFIISKDGDFFYQTKPLDEHKHLMSGFITFFDVEDELITMDYYFGGWDILLKCTHE